MVVAQFALHVVFGFECPDIQRPLEVVLKEGILEIARILRAHVGLILLQHWLVKTFDLWQEGLSDFDFVKMLLDLLRLSFLL